MRMVLAPLLASVLGLGAWAGCSRDPATGSRAAAASASIREAESRGVVTPTAWPAGRGASPVGSTLSTVSVDELDRMLVHHECQAVDANGDATRKRMGVIPGAVLLRDMDAVDQLPADRAASLVFYCANTACRASHEAAEKAIAAGYTRVRLLPEGIAGWVKAGKQTASL